MSDRTMLVASSTYSHRLAFGTLTEYQGIYRLTQLVNSINRAAIVVRPKAPFFDWARSLEGGLPETTEPWTSVYLVDTGESAEPSRVLRRCFAAIFEEQLEGWHHNGDDWPTPRTMDLFQEWFDADVVDLVFDLSEGPIEHDDL